MDRDGAQICIRPVRPGESIDLLALASLPRHDSSRSGSLRPMSLYASNGTQHAVVAREGTDPDAGKVIGVGALRPVEDSTDIAEVFLFVIPDRRTRGLGRRLFETLVDLARNTSVRRLRIRLPGQDVEALGLMSRLSTHANMIPEEGERVRIEFPTAAAVAV